MATKYQTELALKALLTELNRSEQDLYSLVDKAIIRMHQVKLFVKEDTLRERAGAEGVLLNCVEAIVGSRTQGNPGNFEDF